MKIQWVGDYEENAYWDLMQEPKRPKKYPEFDLHKLCIANGECNCGREKTEQTKRIEQARKRKYMVDCE
jgi:endonuclease I